MDFGRSFIIRYSRFTAVRFINRSAVAPVVRFWTDKRVLVSLSCELRLKSKSGGLGCTRSLGVSLLYSWAHGPSDSSCLFSVAGKVDCQLPIRLTVL